MTYAEWTQAMATLLQIADPDGITAFTALAPRFIEYTELRMQRDPALDFLATRVVDQTQMTIGGTRAVSIASAIVILEGVSLLLPSAIRPPVLGAYRVPLVRTTRQFIDSTWPMESQVATPSQINPTYWAVFSMQEAVGGPGMTDEGAAFPSYIIIAPTPDNEYIVEQTGTQRITPLSSSNTTNFLSVNLPDLYIAASMVIASGYQRDFGAQSSDPAMAASWNQQFEALKAGAAVEELRKRAMVAGFSPMIPAATIPRIGGPGGAPVAPPAPPAG
jgi:hypothetical protein